VGVGIVIGGSSYRHGYAGAGADRYGYERGYREGADNGFKAGRRGKRLEFWRDGAYRDDDDGYKRWMGPRWVYEDAFRRGYETGYRRGYSNGLRERREREGWRSYDRDRYGRDRYDWSRRH
jgi:flagellar biosynthesis/type III secretory pathway protein FliH